MAKSKNLIPYPELLAKAGKGFNKNILLLHISEKILIDDFVNKLTLKFLDKKPDNSSLIILDAEDAELEKIANELSSGGFFSEKKVLVLKNIKCLKKDEKVKLAEIIRQISPDIFFVMIASEKEFKSNDYEEFYSENVTTFDIKEFSEDEFIGWVKSRFDDYNISGDAVFRLLQLTNFSFDEVLGEIEKLKTYSYFSKEINLKTINECVGLSKDFAEIDFIKAILERDRENAIKIYSRIILKKDVEIFLIYLLSSSFIIISKLFDPESAKLSGWDQKLKLKLWFEHEKLLPEYKNFRKSINSAKLKMAFEYIHNADKALKTSNTESKTVFSTLVENLCNL